MDSDLFNTTYPSLSISSSSTSSVAERSLDGGAKSQRPRQVQEYSTKQVRNMVQGEIDKNDEKVSNEHHQKAQTLSYIDREKLDKFKRYNVNDTTQIPIPPTPHEKPEFKTAEKFIRKKEERRQSSRNLDSSKRLDSSVESDSENAPQRPRQKQKNSFRHQEEESEDYQEKRRSKQLYSRPPIRISRHTGSYKSRVTHHKRSRSSGQKKRSSETDTGSDIQDIKASLHDHFEAIKSLQNVLSNGGQGTPTTTRLQHKPRSSSIRENEQRPPLPSPLDQTSRDLRDRIRMIETTLRDAGENVSNLSISESDAVSTRPPSLVPGSPPRPKYTAVRPIGFSPIDVTRALHSHPIPTPSSSMTTMNDRLDKMERFMERIASSLAEKEKEKIERTKTEEGELLAELRSEVHKLGFDFKTQEKDNALLREINKKLERKIEVLATFGDGLKGPIDGNLDPSLEYQIKALIQRKITFLESKVAEKVDTAVLEELARHIATKEDLKKYLKKTALEKPGFGFAGGIGAAEKLGIEEKLKKLEQRVKELESLSTPAKHSELFIQGQMADVERQMQHKMHEWVSQEVQLRGKEMEKIMDERVSGVKENIQIGVRALISEAMRNANSEEIPFGRYDDGEYTSPIVRKLVRDFDEKLFTVCSDISSCKQLFVNMSRQPFYRCGQWLWTSGSLKLGSAVPWNIQSCNTDPDNFKWDQDHFNIRIADAGLYEISLAFFTKSKPSIQLVVNGESILSAINSPSYVVQHSSGFVIDGNGRMEPGTVTGISLVDFMALPAKSTLSIHYHGIKKTAAAHGFLALKRL